MPGTDARTFAWAAALFARSLNFRYDGIAIASRIPMMMMTTRSSMSVKPSSAWSRLRMASKTWFSFLHNAERAGIDRTGIGVTSVSPDPPSEGMPEKRRGARLRAPRRKRVSRVLRAGARGDVGGRAGLLVDRGTDCRLDAVRRRRRGLDDDVLDAGVVRSLQHGRRRARVGAMVGVERLHAGDSGANVGLRGRVVRTILELEVRRDRNREQDPDDDDDDQELDEREALVTLEPHPQRIQHFLVLLPSLRGLTDGRACIDCLPEEARPRLRDSH